MKMIYPPSIHSFNSSIHPVKINLLLLLLKQQHQRQTISRKIFQVDQKKKIQNLIWKKEMQIIFFLSLSLCAFSLYMFIQRDENHFPDNWTSNDNNNNNNNSLWLFLLFKRKENDNEKCEKHGKNVW